MLKRYIIYTFRSVLSDKAVSLIKIFGFALGIACTLIIGLWIYDEYGFDGFHNNKNEIFLLNIKFPTEDTDEYGSYFSPYALSPLMKEKYPEIKSYTRFENFSGFSSCMLKYEGERGEERFFYEKEFFLVDNDFFSIFSFPFKYGSAENVLSHPNSIVLSSKVAEKYFGNTNPLGQILTYNNETNYEVTGVVDIPRNTRFQFDFVSPISTQRPTGYQVSWDWNCPTFILLNKGVDIQKFRQKIASCYDTFQPENKAKIIVDLAPLTNLKRYFGYQRIVNLFIIVACLIFVIAFINYINISTSTFAGRTKEIAIKKVTGARKKNLIYQYLSEIIIVLIIAIGFAFIFAELFLPYFNSLTEKDITLFSSFQHNLFIIFLIGGIILFSAFAGIFPAIQFSSYKPVNLLNPKNPGLSQKAGLRKIFVIFQFSVSIILIIFTIIVNKQVKYLYNRPIGFNKEMVIRMPLNNELLEKIDSYKSELIKHPDIKSMTASSTVPFTIGNHAPVLWGSQSENETERFKFAIVIPDYIKTFEMKLLYGKAYEDNLRTDHYGYIVNKAAIERMQMTDPIGQKINLWGVDGEIIGVIDDFENNHFGYKLMPLVLTANPENHFFMKYIFVKISPNNISETIEYLRETTRSFAPNNPFEYNFIDDQVERYFRTEKRLSKILLMFSVLAIFIASLGLFAMSILFAVKYTKQIGIRKVNGATILNMIVMLNKEFVRCVLIAFIIGTPLSYFIISKWLQDFDYKTNLSWWVFTLAGGIAVTIALLTVSWQSWRAASRNPVEALRYE